MRRCVNCGYTANDDEKYCRACGRELAAVVQNKANAVEASAHKGQAGANASEEKSIFSKYADFIDDNALYHAGLCKLNGAGMDKDEEEAFEIFRSLAERGHLDGMYKLAEIYLKKTPPDVQSACGWLNLAAGGGHEPSRIKLQILGKTVSNDSFYSSVGGDSALKNLVARALPNVVLLKSVYKDKKYCSAGAGFIVEGDYVITNAHVVGEKPEEIKASFEPSVDDKIYSLKAVTVRPDLDVAVLKFTGLAEEKIKGREHLCFRLDGAAFGESVYTIGNPLGIGLSVTEGVVSCPNRAGTYKDVDEVIQVDITANHGNSGGALLDRENRVLGMVTFIPGRSEGGITMCVPSKYIVEVLNNL